MSKNAKIVNDVNDVKSKSLTPVNETFNLDDGKYTGIITDAFFYSDDRVMIKIKLPDKKIFLIATDAERVERYPFSRLLMQADIQYIEDLEGLKVDFAVKNNTSESGIIYSNVKKISLAS